MCVWVSVSIAFKSASIGQWSCKPKIKNTRKSSVEAFIFADIFQYSIQADTILSFIHSSFTQNDFYANR